MESPTLSKQRLRLWLRLLRASRGIENGVRNFLREEYGFTLPRFDVLAALHRAGDGLTMSELSRELMVSNGNVTGIVDRLAEDGFVERKHRKGDRRTSLLQLTEAGRSSFVQMARDHESWIDRRLEQLNEIEVANSIKLLEGIQRSAERETQ